MVNKHEKNLLFNFYFRQTAILFLYFLNFNPFLLLFSCFPYLFRFNFVVSERNVHISFFLPTYLGGTFSPLLDISERNFLPRWGGGGVHVHPVHPPCVRA